MGRKAILLVMDSVGIGALPDAERYGDAGSHTIGNIIKARGPLHIPNLYRLGIGNITGVEFPYKESNPIGCYGKSNEASLGKDTTTGHWEIAGVILKTPFPTFPKGFPRVVIEEFERRIGHNIIGNIAASGTEIIKELGEKHMKTGFPIVYTSADSVFQIAAHEDIIPLEELYTQCKIAREIMTGEYGVGRVIARPFRGKPGNFVRTENRKDYSLEPPSETLLDILKEGKYTVAAVGKIEDIFNFRGITLSNHTKGNMESIDGTLDFMNREFDGLIFTNLVDFDMLYGHRNDVEGYAHALEEFDEKIPLIMNSMGDDDILIITADHGCDPTTKSTDHSREYIPILLWGRKLKSNVNIGIRNSYSDIAATLGDFFHVKGLKNGSSFYKEVFK